MNVVQGGLGDSELEDRSSRKGASSAGVSSTDSKSPRAASKYGHSPRLFKKAFAEAVVDESLGEQPLAKGENKRAPINKVSNAPSANQAASYVAEGQKAKDQNSPKRTRKRRGKQSKASENSIQGMPESSAAQEKVCLKRPSAHNDNLNPLVVHADKRKVSASSLEKIDSGEEAGEAFSSQGQPAFSSTKENQWILSRKPEALFEQCKFSTVDQLNQWLDMARFCIQEHPDFKDDRSISKNLVRTLYCVYKEMNKKMHRNKQDLLLAFLDHSFLQDWEHESKKTLPRFIAQGFSNCLFGLSQLRITPSMGWLESWEYESRKKLHTFTEQNLSNCLYAYSLLRVQPSSEWLKAFEKSALCQLDTMTNQALANCIFSWRCLGVDVPPQFWAKVFLKEKMKAANIKGRHQIYLAFQSVKGGPQDIIVDPSYFADIKQTAKREVQTVSQLEIKIQKAIKDIYKDDTFKTQVWIDEIAAYVDLAADDGRILQVDGPDHYLNDGSHDGHTQFQTRLLKSFGYKVLRLSYKDIGNQKGAKATIEWLRNLLKKENFL